uniref:PilN domain-containing protein n=1 Tax=Candidatus Cryptobacteroides bacterium TaxID=3085639 RepID=UPI00402860B9
MRLISKRILPVELNGGTAVVQDGLAEKGDIVILSVFGSDVSSRSCDDSDPVLTRIQRSDDLYWTMYPDKICYVRKAVVESSLNKQKGTYVAGVAVGEVCNEAEEHAKNILSTIDWKRIAGDSEMLEAVAGCIFHRVLLPVLGFWLVALLFNFFLFSDLDRRVSAMRLSWQESKREAKAEKEATGKQRQMLADYKTMSLPKSSVAIDALASVVPDGIQLTLLSVNSSGFRIKGTAKKVSDITEYSSAVNREFPLLEIVSIDKPTGTSLYQFDFRMMK